MPNVSACLGRSFALLCIFALRGEAHVGVKDVVFEGQAGPYPISVLIRPPVVVPGVAEVEVRVGAKDATRVLLTTLTIAGAGSRFPPQPEEARVDKLDKQFFRGASWLMGAGAWQIRIQVDGARGVGVLAVPVAALSERVATMSRGTSAVLFALFALLSFGGIGILSAAWREVYGVRDDEVVPRRQVLIVRVVSAAAMALFLAGGWYWWEVEAAAYSQSIYRPLSMDVQVAAKQLNISLAHSGWYQAKNLDDFIEDHGYKMHLFLISAADQNAFAHLHPAALGKGRFHSPQPLLPAGQYKVFADVLHKSGLAETLESEVQLGVGGEGENLQGGDDSLSLFTVSGKLGSPYVMENGWKVEFSLDEKLVAGKAIQLGFRVMDAEGNIVKNLQPYLGMAAHLILFSKNFRVFAHLHPFGTVSMRAQEMAQVSTDAAPALVVDKHGESRAFEGEIRFPFGFPQSGEYRAVLQFRDLKKIHSVPFDFLVQ